MAKSSSAAKAKLRKSWLKAHAAGERKMKTVIRSFFAGQRERIMAVANEMESFSVASAAHLLDPGLERDELVTLIEPVLGELLATGAARVFKQRPAKASKPKKSKAFDVDLADFDLPSSMRAALQSQLDLVAGQAYWDEIQQGSLALVRDTLADGVERGLSVPNIRKLLESSHTNMSKWRATAIARTETTGALAAGHQVSYETLEADGEKIRKSWLSIIDADTRPDHVEADGQIVDVSETFTVGTESCMHPGDVSLSAKQRVNCRCSSAAEFGD
jgi:hypothetical protein